ncbi:MAG: opacity-associated protein OapA [Lonepinella koalarum]|nr:opacity-associated protein OapA [Lonepinella koalarum]
MERTTDNQQPAQAELDLTQMEPITPKKVIKAEPSFLDKAKGLFARKETADTPRFHERKEPTFGQPAAFAPSINEVNVGISEIEADKSSDPIVSVTPKTTVLPVVDVMPTETESSTEATSIEEKSESEKNEPRVAPVIAEKTHSVKSKLSHPENWAIMQKLPEKHRRLFVAIAVGVLVLLALLWLKPSSETVEEIQANQSNAMPIEFQSLDPNQANQATTAVDNSQAAVPAENVATHSSTPVIAPTNNTVVNNAGISSQSTNTTMPVNNANVKSVEQLQAEKLAEQQRKEAEARMEKARAEKAKAEKLKEEQLAKAKAEKAKAEQQVKTASEKSSVKSGSGVPVVEAKPAGTNKKSNEVPVIEAKKAMASTSSKTLTVPKGVSLMQVFRDNNLNIGDVNAMSKANGADNALSNFKPGDKVQVSLNSQGRVASMRLSNGATFTRQADGSYKYSK